MERFSFIFTICFVLIGPVKIVPAFARLTDDKEPQFARMLAIKGAVIASIICLFVVIAGRSLVSRYELSLQALQLGGGLVLLVSALNAIFPRAEPTAKPGAPRTLLQVAISPLATPIIVTPAGIAALLIFVMSASRFPGVYEALAVVLVVILALDFVVMRFNAQILRIPGLLATLQVFGTVLNFIQLALAIETMLHAMRALDLVGGQ
jgi:multiple antibiotic resistance protein